MYPKGDEHIDQESVGNVGNIGDVRVVMKGVWGYGQRSEKNKHL